MPKMPSLPFFHSSLEKICKNLKTIKLIGTAEPLLINILKKCQKIEDVTLFSYRFHCKSLLKYIFQYLLILDF